MLSWTAEHIFADMVEAMLPTWSGKLALQFRVKISVDLLSYDDGDDRYASDTIEFTFHRPNNFTKVYVRTGDPMSYPQEWLRVSDHDSCWRQDGIGIITQHYLDLCTKQRKRLEKLGKKETRHSFAETIGFDFFGGKPRYVLIEDKKALEESMYPKRWSLKINEDENAFNIEKLTRERAKAAGEPTI